MTSEEANALLRELIEAHSASRSLSLAWAVRHAQDGGDPVAAAWAAATRPGWMRQLLLRLDHPATEPGASAWPQALRCAGWLTPRCTLARCDACIALIRAAVPTLTLADVVAATQRAA